MVSIHEDDSAILIYLQDKTTLINDTKRILELSIVNIVNKKENYTAKKRRKRILKLSIVDVVNKKETCTALKRRKRHKKRRKTSSFVHKTRLQEDKKFVSDFTKKDADSGSAAKQHQQQTAPATRINQGCGPMKQRYYVVSATDD